MQANLYSHLKQNTHIKISLSLMALVLSTNLLYNFRETLPFMTLLIFSLWLIWAFYSLYQKYQLRHLKLIIGDPSLTDPKSLSIASKTKKFFGPTTYYRIHANPDTLYLSPLTESTPEKIHSISLTSDCKQIILKKPMTVLHIPTVLIRTKKGALIMPQSVWDYLKTHYAMDTTNLTINSNRYRLATAWFSLGASILTLILWVKIYSNLDLKISLVVLVFYALPVLAAMLTLVMQLRTKKHENN